MIYAAKTQDGAWTGAVYDRVSPAIVAHHSAFGETVEMVEELANVGTDDAPEWDAKLPDVSALRETWTASRFQIRAALAVDGLLDAAAEAVAGSGDPVLKVAWADAQEWPRTSKSFHAVASALGMDDEAADALFVKAMAITA